MTQLLKIITLFILSTSFVLADKIPVTTSFSILGDLVEQIGGERVLVTTIVGPDQDAHIYQISPNDLKKYKTQNS